MAEGSADTSSIKVAQTQLNQGLIQNLPSESVNAALSSILTLATPGVAADSNGVFHLLGEHAEPPSAQMDSRSLAGRVEVSQAR